MTAHPAPSLAPTSISDVEEARLTHLKAWRTMGLDPYNQSWQRSDFLGALQETFKDVPVGTATDKRVKVAGRIHTVRNSGMFIDIEDPTGKIQIYHSIKTISAEIKTKLDLLDAGDVIGVEGILRRTPRGELTVDAEQFVVLAKAIVAPPEKFHGLADPDIRYRKRHLDMAADATVRERFQKRALIIKTMRQVFEENRFMEVETPMLHTIPGGAAARPFLTHHNALDIPLYLRIAPELFLKRLIVGGVADRVFEINRCFRNEGVSFKHNPEFTSVECYQLLANYHDMMALTEAVVTRAVAAVNNGNLVISYQGQELNFTAPWRRATMTDLVKEATGVDFMGLTDAKAARAAAEKIGVTTKPSSNWGQIVEAVFSEKVEKTLLQPTHVIDLPRDISPLAKGKPGHPMLAERFETYVNGWELANAFSELNDPFDQYDRFLQQIGARDAGDDEAHLLDENFVEALEFGMPPTGGLGIGIDRLVILLTDAPTIREVIAFPTMRPSPGESLVRRLHEAGRTNDFKA
jgi:lysyl-tRNA synthetase, class II